MWLPGILAIFSAALALAVDRPSPLVDGSDEETLLVTAKSFGKRPGFVNFPIRRVVDTNFNHHQAADRQQPIRDQRRYQPHQENQFAGIPISNNDGNIAGQRPYVFFDEGKDVSMVDAYRRRQFYGPTQGPPYIQLTPGSSSEGDYAVHQPARVNDDIILRPLHQPARVDPLPCNSLDSGAVVEGECVPLVHCPRFFRRRFSVKNEGLGSTTTVTTVPTKEGILSRCPLDNFGAVGVCCPYRHQQEPSANPDFIPPGSSPVNDGKVFPTYVQDPSGGILSRKIPKSDVDKARIDARQKMEELEVENRRLIDAGDHIQPGSPASLHQSFNRASSQAQALGNQALAEIEAARALRAQFGAGQG